MLKQLSSKELIITKRSYKKENRKEMTYRLDEAYIKYHIDLSTYKNNYSFIPWITNKYKLDDNRTSRFIA